LARAAEARAEQEVDKARAVTQAEKLLEVAQLQRQTAAEEKAAIILKGEGEARYKQLVMQADGALNEKLEALVQMNKDMWTAIGASQHPWVPSTVMGTGNGGNGVSELTQLNNLMTLQLSRQLGVDVTPKGGN
jgi:uncharacterized membrane protein YqiK